VATKWLKQNGLWVRCSSGKGIVGADGTECCPLQECGRWVDDCNGNRTDLWVPCGVGVDVPIAFASSNGSQFCGKTSADIFSPTGTEGPMLTEWDSTLCNECNPQCRECDGSITIGTNPRCLTTGLCCATVGDRLLSVFIDAGSCAQCIQVLSSYGAPYRIKLSGSGTASVMQGGGSTRVPIAAEAFEDSDAGCTSALEDFNTDPMPSYIEIISTPPIGDGCIITPPGLCPRCTAVNGNVYGSVRLNEIGEYISIAYSAGFNIVFSGCNSSGVGTKIGGTLVCSSHAWGYEGCYDGVGGGLGRSMSAVTLGPEDQEEL